MYELLEHKIVHNLMELFKCADFDRSQENEHENNFPSFFNQTQQFMSFSSRMMHTNSIQNGTFKLIEEATEGRGEHENDKLLSFVVLNKNKQLRYSSFTLLLSLHSCSLFSSNLLHHRTLAIPPKLFLLLAENKTPEKPKSLYCLFIACVIAHRYQKITTFIPISEASVRTMHARYSVRYLNVLSQWGVNQTLRQHGACIREPCKTKQQKRIHVLLQNAKNQNLCP